MEQQIENISKTDLLSLTSEIVSSYVANNQTEKSDLQLLIQQVYSALQTVGSGTNYVRIAERDPAVPVDASVFDDYIVCLEDGKRLKMLKRHIRSSYGLTPEQYRERWGLASDYPMVAPNYAARRSSLAKTIGLGRGRKKKLSVAA